MTDDVTRAEVAADVRRWLTTQVDRVEALAAMVAVPSLPGTLEQNDVLDLTMDIVGSHQIVTTDRFVPDWDALRSFESPLDSQRLCCPLEPAERYAEVLPSLEAAHLQLHGEQDSSGPILTLNGHVDVVPADNQSWTGNPFAARLRDGRLIARGAMDMKAGLLAAALAFRYVAETTPALGRLSFAVVPEEETGGNGTLALLHRGHVPDAVVFTEPTDLQVVHRHVGIQRFDVEVAGIPGGMLRRSWGSSAVPDTARVALALESLEAARTERAFATGGYDDDDLPGYINTTMESGDWIATRAASGRLSGLMGVLPGETQADAANELRAVVHDAAPSAVTRVWPGGHRGAEIPVDHLLVRSFVEHSAAPGGPGAATRAGTMVCDAKIVQGGGWAPSVVLGPRGGGLHSADEWVDMNSIDECVQLLVSGAHAFFKSPQAQGSSGPT